jgi:hypothetical protein
MACYEQPMKTIEPPRNLATRTHRDGTVSYWSVSQGRWVDRTIYVPEEDLERMEPRDQQRVRRHLLVEEHCSRS